MGLGPHNAHRWCPRALSWGTSKGCPLFLLSPGLKTVDFSPDFDVVVHCEEVRYVLTYFKQVGLEERAAHAWMALWCHD
jgi:hypothetical protein